MFYLSLSKQKKKEIVALDIINRELITHKYNYGKENIWQGLHLIRDNLNDF